MTIIIKQIGKRMALTAAHCLYDEDDDKDKRDLLPASSFSIMLGLHDRRKIKEPKRWMFHHKFKICISIFVSGDRSESTRSSSMKTSQTP